METIKPLSIEPFRSFTGNQAVASVSHPNTLPYTSINTANVGIEWAIPERVEINEYPDSIEMIYIQEGVDYSKTHLTIYPPFPAEHHRRTFKIVYSCVDGKWNKSEPIYGKIIPATEETYEFED